MPNVLLLNYGGPGDYYYSRLPSKIDSIIHRCIVHYGGPGWVTSSTCEIGELKVTLYAFAIHRALIIEQPDEASDKTKALFEAAYNMTKTECAKPYSLLEHNCVRATATVLHELDKTLPSTLSSPWALDDCFKKYIQLLNTNQKKPLPLQQFMKTYHQHIASSFTFFENPYWLHHELTSIEALVEKLHDKQEERTLAVLTKMKWIVNKNIYGQFIAGERAPEDFKKGLDHYYKQFALYSRLKINPSASNDHEQSHPNPK